MLLRRDALLWLLLLLFFCFALLFAFTCSSLLLGARLSVFINPPGVFTSRTTSEERALEHLRRLGRAAH